MFSGHDNIATSLPPLDGLPTRMEGNIHIDYTELSSEQSIAYFDSKFQESMNRFVYVW